MLCCLLYWILKTSRDISFIEFSDWFWCSWVKPGGLSSSSVSHETVPLQENERAVIFRLDLLLSGGARDFFYISWDNPCTGVWAGGDIPAGSAAVWWSPGSGGLLLYLMRQSLYRSMSGRWYSDWVCCCLVEPGVRGSSSSFRASTSTRRSTCELRHLTCRPKRSAGLSTKDSVNERNTFPSSSMLPSLRYLSLRGVMSLSDKSVFLRLFPNLFGFIKMELAHTVNNHCFWGGKLHLMFSV
jgi:hypothetical protein